MSRLGWASIYRCNGWFPVPVPLRAKGPTIKGWQTLRLGETELEDRFSNAGNIGLRLGTVSAGLCDVDLDSTEALQAADTFVPPTNMVSGRASKPRSHRWYVLDPTPTIIVFRDPLIEDPKKATLLELRANAKKRDGSLQTIVPPSLHDETGESIRWDRDRDGILRLAPARVPAQDLITAVTHTAVCALIARYWQNKGEHGHELVLALSGAFLRVGLELDTVKKIIVTAARIAGYPRARGADIDDTARNLAEGREVTGWPTVGELLGEKIAAQLQKWLRGNDAGCSAGNPNEAKAPEPKSRSKAARLLELVNGESDPLPHRHVRVLREGQGRSPL